MSDSSDSAIFERRKIKKPVYSESNESDYDEDLFSEIFGTGDEYAYIYEGASTLKNDIKDNYEEVDSLKFNSKKQENSETNSDVEAGSDSEQDFENKKNTFYDHMSSKSKSYDGKHINVCSPVFKPCDDTIYTFVTQKPFLNYKEKGAVDMMLKGLSVYYIFFHTECPYHFFELLFLKERIGKYDKLREDILGFLQKNNRIDNTYEHFVDQKNKDNANSFYGYSNFDSKNTLKNQLQNNFKSINPKFKFLIEKLENPQIMSSHPHIKHVDTLNELLDSIIVNRYELFFDNVFLTSYHFAENFFNSHSMYIPKDFSVDGDVRIVVINILINLLINILSEKCFLPMEFYGCIQFFLVQKIYKDEFDILIRNKVEQDSGFTDKIENLSNSLTIESITSYIYNLGNDELFAHFEEIVSIIYSNNPIFTKVFTTFFLNAEFRNKKILNLNLKEINELIDVLAIFLYKEDLEHHNICNGKKKADKKENYMGALEWDSECAKSHQTLNVLPDEITIDLNNIYKLFYDKITDENKISINIFYKTLKKILRSNLFYENFINIYLEQQKKSFKIDLMNETLYNLLKIENIASEGIYFGMTYFDDFFFCSVNDKDRQIDFFVFKLIDIKKQSQREVMEESIKEQIGKPDRLGEEFDTKRDDNCNANNSCLEEVRNIENGWSNGINTIDSDAWQNKTHLNNSTKIIHDNLDFNNAKCIDPWNVDIPGFDDNKNLHDANEKITNIKKNISESLSPKNSIKYGSLYSEVLENKLLKYKPRLIAFTGTDRYVNRKYASIKSIFEKTFLISREIPDILYRNIKEFCSGICKSFLTPEIEYLKVIDSGKLIPSVNRFINRYNEKIFNCSNIPIETCLGRELKFKKIIDSFSSIDDSHNNSNFESIPYCTQNNIDLNTQNNIMHDLRIHLAYSSSCALYSKVINRIPQNFTSLLTQVEIMDCLQISVKLSLAFKGIKLSNLNEFMSAFIYIDSSVFKKIVASSDNNSLQNIETFFVNSSDELIRKQVLNKTVEIKNIFSALKPLVERNLVNIHGNLCELSSNLRSLCCDISSSMSSFDYSEEIKNIHKKILSRIEVSLCGITEIYNYFNTNSSQSINIKKTIDENALIELKLFLTNLQNKMIDIGNFFDIPKTIDNCSKKLADEVIILEKSINNLDVKHIKDLVSNIQKIKEIYELPLQTMYYTKNTLINNFMNTALFLRGESFLDSKPIHPKNYGYAKVIIEAALDFQSNSIDNIKNDLYKLIDLDLTGIEEKSLILMHKIKGMLICNNKNTDVLYQKDFKFEGSKRYVFLEGTEISDQKVIFRECVGDLNKFVEGRIIKELNEYYIVGIFNPSNFKTNPIDIKGFVNVCKNNPNELGSYITNFLYSIQRNEKLNRYSSEAATETSEPNQTDELNNKSVEYFPKNIRNTKKNSIIYKHQKSNNPLAEVFVKKTIECSVNQLVTVQINEENTKDMNFKGELVKEFQKNINDQHTLIMDPLETQSSYYNKSFSTNTQGLNNDVPGIFGALENSGTVSKYNLSAMEYKNHVLYRDISFKMAHEYLRRTNKNITLCKDRDGPMFIIVIRCNNNEQLPLFWNIPVLETSINDSIYYIIATNTKYENLNNHESSEILETAKNNYFNYKFSAVDKNRINRDFNISVFKNIDEIISTYVKDIFRTLKLIVNHKKYFKDSKSCSIEVLSHKDRISYGFYLSRKHPGYVVFAYGINKIKEEFGAISNGISFNGKRYINLDEYINDKKKGK
ncbi:hypothetical protein EDEG_00365 [Edhazardia aedis USNM 41457]|uniref:Spt6 SH2 domain-containing protein n=1 Tax=Edhazardia aedis (strain USNM 41457) TaxID=1003232 RepID=J9D2G9_EDHAE|nr:hypothetical protein EDEG_00365 [Edhazardia aedis USNM 41457]|eukprot:EJW01774.1 hypothetical protein EDEG_00365 [Edhazardia aedis USNM 41457]